VEWMAGWGVGLIDCQQETAHLARFGAVPWPRLRFVAEVAERVRSPTRRERWTLAPDA